MNKTLKFLPKPIWQRDWPALVCLVAGLLVGWGGVASFKYGDVYFISLVPSVMLFVGLAGCWLWGWMAYRWYYFQRVDPYEKAKEYGASGIMVFLLAVFISAIITAVW